MKMVFRLAMILAVAALLRTDLIQSAVVKGTLITTTQDQRCVEDLRVGDEVVGFDTSTQVIVKARVTAISKRSSKSIIQISTEQEDIFAATDQQFFDPVAEEWILASDFALTNHLLDSKGNHVKCCALASRTTDEEKFIIYDISTTTPHTFFVTESQFLTHNILPVAIGISFAFDSLFALASWAFAGAAVSVGAIAVGTAGIAINHVQAVKDLEKCFKDSLSNQTTQDHILQDKHKWPELVPDPKNNWDKIVEIITTVVVTGSHEPHHTTNVYTATVTIANRIVQVRYWIDNGAKIISDAWVR